MLYDFSKKAIKAACLISHLYPLAYQIWTCLLHCFFLSSSLDALHCTEAYFSLAAIAHCEYPSPLQRTSFSMVKFPPLRIPHRPCEYYLVGTIHNTQFTPLKEIPQETIAQPQVCSQQAQNDSNHHCGITKGHLISLYLSIMLTFYTISNAIRSMQIYHKFFLTINV